MNIQFNASFGKFADDFLIKEIKKRINIKGKQTVYVTGLNFLPILEQKILTSFETNRSTTVFFKTARFEVEMIQGDNKFKIEFNSYERKAKNGISGRKKGNDSKGTSQHHRKEP